jgi:hypothetical protein
MSVIDYLQRRRDGALFELGRRTTPDAWEETRLGSEVRLPPFAPSAVVRLVVWPGSGREWFRFSGEAGIAADLREQLTAADYSEAQIREVARRIAAFASDDVRIVDDCGSHDIADCQVVASRYFDDQHGAADGEPLISDDSDDPAE